jgi:hypothetical protein
MRLHLRIWKWTIMPRTTITLSEERYRALRQVAARRGQTITEVVDPALELAGVNRADSVGGCWPRRASVRA